MAFLPFWNFPYLGFRSLYWHLPILSVKWAKTHLSAFSILLSVFLPFVLLLLWHFFSEGAIGPHSFFKRAGGGGARVGPGSPWTACGATGAPGRRGRLPVRSQPPGQIRGAGRRRFTPRDPRSADPQIRGSVRGSSARPRPARTRRLVNNFYQAPRGG